MSTLYKSTNPTFGLRILYGAAVAMCVTRPNVAWEVFLGQFSDFHELSASDAVDLLWEVYGSKRRILILVDELVQMEAIGVGADKSVMRQIGDLLSRYGTLDVVVSALSPQYVTSLVASACRRAIHYVVLESLVDRGLGRAETGEWASTMLASMPVPDPIAQRLLRSVYVLCSGHPRSIEMLVESFDENGRTICWSATRELLSVAGQTFPALLSAFIFDLLDSRHPASSILKVQLPYMNDVPANIACLREALSVLIRDDSTFRTNLEKGAIYILPKSAVIRMDLRLTISLVAFLTLVKRLGNARDEDQLLITDPLVNAAIVFFYKAGSTGELFERAVGLTVVCYSRLGQPICSDMSEALGCKSLYYESAPYVAPKLTARFAETVQQMLVSATGPSANEFVIAPPGFPGFDGRVTTIGSKSMPAQYYYLEPLIAKKVMLDGIRARVSKVVTALIAHFVCTLHLSAADRLASYSNVYIVFYEWGELSTDMSGLVDISRTVFNDEVERQVGAQAPKVESAQKYMSGLVTELNLSTTTSYDEFEHWIYFNEELLGELRLCIEVYLNKFTTASSNTVRVYVVNRAILKEWLVPPLLPIPYLVDEES